MKIEFGDCTLTTDHASSDTDHASSDGAPVLIIGGIAYGSGDLEQPERLALIDCANHFRKREEITVYEFFAILEFALKKQIVLQWPPSLPEAVRDAMLDGAITSEKMAKTSQRP